MESLLSEIVTDTRLALCPNLGDFLWKLIKTLLIDKLNNAWLLSIKIAQFHFENNEITFTLKKFNLGL